MDTSPRGKRLAVFEAPPIPDGWHGREVIRIIDPLGLQAAWIAPHWAGGVIGYYARQTTAETWIDVLAAPASGVLGCELLAFGPEPAPLDTMWELETRDPTAAVVRGTLRNLRLVIATRCDDDGLHVTIEGEHSAPADIGLRISPRPPVASVEAAMTGQGGFIRFRDGDLAGIAYRHDLRMHCRPAHGETGIRQIDFVAGEPGPGDRSPIELVFSAAFAQRHTELGLAPPEAEDHTLRLRRR